MLRTSRSAVLLASSVLLLSCDRSGEGAPGGRSADRPGPASELPEGHPDLGGAAPDPGMDLPEGHPAIGGSPHAGMGLPEGHPDPGSEPALSGADRNRAGGLEWSVPDAFRPTGEHSRMRLARFEVAEAEGGGEASLTVFHFGRGQGGEVEANVDRWLGQVHPADGRPAREAARIERTVVNGVAVTTVDVTGTYAAVGPMGGSAASQPGQRLLGAIAEGPDGPVFFKLVGPAATLARVEEQFRALVGSIRPSS